VKFFFNFRNKAREYTMLVTTTGVVTISNTPNNHSAALIVELPVLALAFACLEHNSAGETYLESDHFNGVAHVANQSIAQVCFFQLF